MKKKRQDALLRLIAAEEIATQEQLRQRMAELGFDVTQATLSRDIRELGLRKEHRNGSRACYAAPVEQPLSDQLRELFHGAALRTDYAGTIAVIHCHVGTAQAVCASLDALHREDVVGTIAGDDTIFVLMRTEKLAKEFAVAFAELMKAGGTSC